MEPKKQLKVRHKEASAELKKVALPYIDNNTLNSVALKIGGILGVSFQTVVNYVYGKAKDGFLTEAICNEFKKLKENN
jgi:hypothetical protein